jgi:hypothetical protein
VDSIVTIVQNGGPTALAAVMAALYLLERSERQKAQAARESSMERLLTALIDSTHAIRSINKIVTGDKDA